MAKVIVRVEGRYVVDVPDTIDVKEAVALANEIAGEADFGELSNIEWDAKVYEDADGNRCAVDHCNR
jgi:hypothetical protein